MVNKNGIIIYKTSNKKGHRHDYNIYKKNHPIVPNQVINVLDSGISWYRKRFSRTVIGPAL